MRKAIIIVAVLCLIVSVFCACNAERGRVSSDPDGMITDPPHSSAPVTETPDDPESRHECKPQPLKRHNALSAATVRQLPSCLIFIVIPLEMRKRLRYYMLSFNVRM